MHYNKLICKVRQTQQWKSMFAQVIGHNSKRESNEPFKHYNKTCPCTPSDFNGFCVNSLVPMNGT